MKFNVILISMAIGLLSHAVISAPVDNNNDVVADNDSMETEPYHIDVPGADINIDEHGVQVEKKPQDDDAQIPDNANQVNVADRATGTEDDTDASSNNDDPSTIDKRSPLFGNSQTGSHLDVTSDGIDVPDAGIHVGGDDNDLAEDDMQPLSSLDDGTQTGLTKRRLGGGLAATRDGVDVAPLGLHLGRNSDNPNMATPSDAAQLQDVTDLLTKRNDDENNDDENNDDDGDDLKKQQQQSSGSTHSSKRQYRQQQHPTGLSPEEIDDLMTKREHDSQGPPPAGLTPEELDDFNTKKRDRMDHYGHQNVASYGEAGYRGASYPNRYISEDLADAMT